MGDNKYSRNGTRENYRRRSVALLEELPAFCEGYFIEQSEEHESSSVYCYLLGIRIFLRYLQDKGLCHVMSIKEIEPADLGKLTGKDLSLYIDCLTDYEDNGIKHKSGSSAVKARIAAVRLLFQYLHKEKLISSADMADAMKCPKLQAPPSRAVSRQEVKKLTRAVMDKDLFADDRKMQANHKISMKRDVAIITLLSSSGIRISELAALDLEDVDLNRGSIRVQGREGEERNVPLDWRVRKVLADYIGEPGSTDPGIRTGRKDIPAQERALFLSRKRSRMSPNSIDRMIKKYTQKVLGKDFRVTPGILRNSGGDQIS